MAKANNKDETKLLISKSEAKDLITERISKGTELLNTNIKTQATLGEEEEKFSKWGKYNNQLLEKIFSNSKIADEYSYWGMMVTSFKPLQQEIIEHFDSIKNKIGRLESIIERLELFEEINTILNEKKVRTAIKSGN